MSGTINLRTEVFELREVPNIMDGRPDALPVLQVYIDNIR